MPLPIPNIGEEKQDFISRCVSEISDMGEFESQKQRVAVCYSQWDKENESMNIINKIDRIQEELGLYESGIRNIRKLANEYKNAVIYFHKDL